MKVNTVFPTKAKTEAKIEGICETEPFLKYMQKKHKQTF